MNRFSEDQFSEFIDALHHIGDRILEPHLGEDANIPARTIQEGLFAVADSIHALRDTIENKS